MRDRKNFFNFLFLSTIIYHLSSSPLEAVPNFSQESGIKVASASVQAILSTATLLRMYFIRDNVQIRTATSTAAGLTWYEEDGIKLSTSAAPSLDASSITSCSILALDSGGFRMLYLARSSTGSFHVLSATSANGISWAKEAGVRLEASPSSSFVGWVRLNELSAGRWRLYFIQDPSGTNDKQNYELGSAISSDEGKTWTPEGKRISAPVGPIAISTLTDSRVRVLHLAPLTNQTTYSQVLSYISSDGLSFVQETSVRLSTNSASGALESVTLNKADSFRWRLYFSFITSGSTTPYVYSALTSSPTIDSISPNIFYRTQSSVGVTIKGEVFSTTPTLKLAKSGESDVNAIDVSRGDDQTITATFNPRDKTLGRWSLVVINNDSATDTLNDAVLIDYSEGKVELLDNLFKPKEGQRVKIDVTTYDNGVLTLRLFTQTGMVVKTLLDDFRALGVQTIYWNGDNEQGHTVASGLYFLHSKGPKLNSIDKIILVK